MEQPPCPHVQVLTPLLALLGLTPLAAFSLRGDVLIVADEFPAMEVLARQFKTEAGITSRIVAQTNLPPSLAPDHFIMTNRVIYPDVIRARGPKTSSDVRRLPGFTLANTEVYLNHRFTAPRTVLMGFQYREAPTGAVYVQDRAGWLRPYGKGCILYFQPGHTAADFADATYRRILLNAVLYIP